MLEYFNKKQPVPGSGPVEPVYRVSPNGRTSSHPDGVVFLHLETGVLFKANRVGALIWEGVLKDNTLETIALQISREFAVPASRVAQDTAGFLADLEAQGFLCRNVGN
jgi:hypothetical protein